ncbi:MAG: hypothetical protein EHM81_06275 [Chloroflexi bacterium]|nr:MAG: hypothetical protein EHM81_06275 [Chloroflexota bacterium]
MMPDFNFLTTHVGSVPHPEPGDLPARLAGLLDIPSWTQHPRRSFRESMYVQYSPSLPAVLVDEAREKIILDTRSDLTPALEAFYTPYLADDVEAFALRPDYAAGFFAMLETLKGQEGPQTEKPWANPTSWGKGQVTGPISFGLTVTDQDLRATLYNELLADVIVKNMAMNARWQARQLKPARENVIIFTDEPYMASFGSAFISLGREQAVAYLDEVYDAIHAEGAVSGVHCCANTDWGLLLSTKVDILNLDAYGYIENLALYPAEVREFLDRGGAVCWGLIPNNEQVFNETPQGLADRLRNGIKLICEKASARGVAIKPGEFASRSLVAPACGLGSTSIEIADRAFDILAETGSILKKG